MPLPCTPLVSVRRFLSIPVVAGCLVRLIVQIGVPVGPQLFRRNPASHYHGGLPGGRLFVGA